VALTSGDEYAVPGPGVVRDIGIGDEAQVFLVATGERNHRPAVPGGFGVRE
jgi:hypothetical protein